MSRARPCSVMVLVTLLLSACAGSPPLSPLPAPTLPVSFGAASEPAVLPNVSAGVQATWGCLGDPVLTSVVEQALRNHPDIALAAVRVEQAAASTRVRQAERRPSLGVSASAQRQRFADDQLVSSGAPDGVSTTNRLGVVATGRWDFDLQGRLASLASAENARLGQALAQLEDTRRQVAADVAVRVLLIRSLQAKLDAREQALQAQRGRLALAERRQAAGLVPANELARLRSDLARDVALQASLQRESRETIQTLTQYLQVTVTDLQAWLRYAAGDNRIDCTLDPGEPGELLTRRADLMAAYQSVVAASSDREAAEAGRRPTLVFDSALGWSAVKLAGLSAGGALMASLGATLDQRLFDFGRIEAQIARSRAAEREAWLRYQTAARQAVGEVEAALAGIAAGQSELAAVNAALAQQARVVEGLRQVAQAGLTDPAATLSAKQEYALLLEQRAESLFQNRRALVILIRDLGRFR